MQLLAEALVTLGHLGRWLLSTFKFQKTRAAGVGFPAGSLSHIPHEYPAPEGITQALGPPVWHGARTPAPRPTDRAEDALCYPKHSGLEMRGSGSMQRGLGAGLSQHFAGLVLSLLGQGCVSPDGAFRDPELCFLWTSAGLVLCASLSLAGFYRTTAWQAVRHGAAGARLGAPRVHVLGYKRVRLWLPGLSLRVPSLQT